MNQERDFQLTTHVQEDFKKVCNMGKETKMKFLHIKENHKEPEVHIEGIHRLFPLEEVDQFEH